MKRRFLSWFFATILLSAMLLAREASAAVDLIVEHNPSGTNHFSTIELALEYAKNQLSNSSNTNSFRVVVQADSTPYTTAAQAVTNVPIVGTSTGGTFLTGSSTSPIISVSGVSNVTISNLTFINGATVGVSVSNGSSGISIKNNVFDMGSGSTAVQVASTSNTAVVNNTFYNNGTALSTASDITISNDIFASNSIAISTQVSLSNLSYCDFYGNSSNGVSDLGSFSIPRSGATNANPLFVDAGNRDFELQNGSPAIGTGNPNYPNPGSTSSDMGAFGGPGSSTSGGGVIPTVTGVTTTLLSTATVQVSWNATGDSAVRFYRVYYGTASRSSSSYSNSLLIPVGTTSTTISGISVPTVTAPAPATLVNVSPLNKGLRVTWNAVTGATGYQIYYSTTSFTDSTLPANSLSIDGGSTTTADLSGLVNGQQYFVAVQAFTQPKLFVAVTALIDGSVAASQGTSNESSFSTESSVALEAAKTAALSQLLPGTPEATAPFPNLKGEGCFIATAAFGFYSAPAVQVLRDFRDRYLMTNEPGRAFVAWYYRYGPIGARYLNAHPWLKAPVRVALLPLILLSLFLLYVPFPLKVALMASAVFGVWLHSNMKKKVLVGEVW